jgi:tetratricopeptide (TPR) repeat protein
MLGIVDLLERDGPSPELANAYAGLSIVASHIGQAGLAEMYGRLAQTTARRLGRFETETFVLQVKALSRLRLHRWEEVYAPASEAAARFARLGDRRRWEECAEYLGYVAMLKGEWAQVLELFSEKAASARQRNDANSTLMALWYLITIQLLLGRIQEALDAIQTGFELLEHSSDPKFEMFLWARLAQAHLRQGSAGALQRAEQALERGKRLADEPSSTLISGVASCALASAALEMWKARGQPAGERQSLAQFLKKSNANARRDWRPATLPLLWRLQGWEAWLSGKPARARQLWRKSLTVAERLKIDHEAGLTHYVLGQHVTGKARQGHLQKAREIFERLGVVYDLEQARHALEAR